MLRQIEPSATPSSADFSIDPVLSSRVPDVWPEVSGLVTKALSYANGRWHAIDVFDSLIATERQLWLVCQGDKIVAMVITEIVSYPRRKAARIFAIAGQDVRTWADLMDETLCQWARHNGCDLIEAGGRMGLSRLLPQYRTESVTLERTL